MEQDSQDDLTGMSVEETTDKGRTKKKIRIKYRERIRIKKRPEGNRFVRYWRKNKMNIIAATVLVALLGFTTFMIAKVLKEQIEMNHEQKKKNMKIIY